MNVFTHVQYAFSPARCRFQHSAGAARHRLAEKLPVLPGAALRRNWFPVQYAGVHPSRKDGNQLALDCRVVYKNAPSTLDPKLILQYWFRSVIADYDTTIFWDTCSTCRPLPWFAYWKRMTGALNGIYFTTIWFVSESLTCALRRSIVLQFFWHVDTRPILPFLFFFNSTFYLCIIIVTFYLMYLIH